MTQFQARLETLPDGSFALTIRAPDRDDDIVLHGHENFDLDEYAKIKEIFPETLKFSAYRKVG
jgi:hypothetical protein